MAVEAGDSLQEIRSLELEMGRALEESRESAAARSAEARMAADAAVETAIENGRREAERAYEAAVRAAEAEAERIRASGRITAARLVEEAGEHLDEAVSAVFALVLSQPQERGK